MLTIWVIVYMYFNPVAEWYGPSIISRIVSKHALYQFALLHGMTCYRAHGPGPVISDPADVGDVLVVGAVVAHVHPIIPSFILSRKNKTKMGQTFAKLFPIPRNCNSRSDKDCGTCAW